MLQLTRKHSHAQQVLHQPHTRIGAHLLPACRYVRLPARLRTRPKHVQGAPLLAQLLQAVC